MHKVYSIIPSICNNGYDEGTIEYIVVNHFWLFKVVTTAEPMLHYYISYINRLFDRVFDKIPIKIVCYEFPEDIMPFSGAMELYINETYGLTDTPNEVYIAYALETHSYHHPLLGNIDIMTNCMMEYEFEMTYEDFQTVFTSTKIRAEIFWYSQYLVPEIRAVLRPIINRFVQYASYIHSAVIENSGAYSSDVYNVLDESYHLLYLLQQFVQYERNKSEEERI